MSFTVKEQREHSLRVFAAEASAWIQLLVAKDSQIAAVQAEVTKLGRELKQAKRQQTQTRAGSVQQLKGSTMAGLAQGLGFLRTRRVDLSGESFGDVDPEQALAIATACGSELD
eukprot:COSAG01_NODE_14667_length_1423_cov_4.092145_1_plen_113_part_10